MFNLPLVVTPAITAEMLAPLTEGITANIGVILPVCVGIMAIFICVGLMSTVEAQVVDYFFRADL